MEPVYNAQLLICLPNTLPDLPFYNLHINVDGDSIGSSYATEIAGELFKEFEKMWSEEQLTKLLENVDYKVLRACLDIKIIDRQNDMKEINDGANEVGHSTIHIFLDLIKQKVGS